MGKSAILLALAGLIVGLWLGFNPTTHRELQRWWTRTSASQTAEKPSTATNMREFDRRITLWFQTEARPASPPAAQSSPAPNGQQISATLQAFWRALEQIAAQLLIKLGIKTV